MIGIGVEFVLRRRKGWAGLRHNHEVGTSDRCYCKRVKASENLETGLRAVRVTSSPGVSEKRMPALYHSIGNGFKSMDKACLDTPYSRMNKKQTWQTRKELLQYRRKETASRRLQRRACPTNGSTVGYWRKW